MKVAVFTVSLPDYDPGEAVAALRAFGYDGVEWRVIDQRPSADGKPGFWSGNRCTWPLSSLVEDAPRIRALAEGAGLGMPNLGTYVGCSELESVERAMRGAAALGIPTLRIAVPRYDGTTPYLPARDRARDQYREVAQMARRHGVRALVELHHGSLLPSASAAASFLDGFDPAEVGVIHDAGNMVYEGFEDYRLGLEMLGPYLGHVHVKDGRWVRGRSGWAAEAAPLGDGMVDLPRLFAALAHVGYDGWLGVEDFSTDRSLPDRLRRNLTRIRAALGEAQTSLASEHPS